MPYSRLHARRALVPALAPLLAACGGKAPPPSPEPETVPPAEAAAPEEVVVLRVDTVTVRDALQDQRIARLELQVLEKEAEIEQLQVRLDDARREVVRAMAKLQSLATRAEAASAMAEAEVAVAALAGSPAGRGTPEVAQARSLLGMSTQEFNRANYGGALYLANQAKSIASAARSRVADAGRGGSRPGESMFAVPLRIQAMGRTNVREGPSTDEAVLYTVDRGAVLVAYAALGDWIRVTDVTGRPGWIIRSRIGRREDGGS
jgi:uncharacterized coiled-coil protein SlyX